MQKKSATTIAKALLESFKLDIKLSPLEYKDLTSALTNKLLNVFELGKQESIKPQPSIETQN